MEKLHFSIHINAPREKVWHAMLDDATYRQWTAPFNPDTSSEGSYYIGDWSQGSKISFVSKNKEGQLEGMLGTIAENRQYEFMSIQYYGMMMKGIEDTTSDEVKKWAGGTENYTLNEVDGGTELLIDVDTNEEFKAFFSEAWPKALDVLKEIAEK